MRELFKYSLSKRMKGICKSSVTQVLVTGHSN